MKFFPAVFYGPRELRAGWRLVIFFVLFFLASIAVITLMRPLGHLTGEESRAIARLLGTVIPLLIAGFVMAKLEGRKMADYGIPWRHPFGKHFWHGVLIGFPTITTLVAAMYLAGVVSFSEGTPQGAVIWLYAVAYALYFLVAALFEEFSFRGYLLFTFTTGMGFWPAAVLTSLLFGLAHRSNPGETVFGCVSVAVFGFLLCLMLRRSGSLWLPIGFHAAYNWGEAFFYGTTDSGLVAPERLVTAKISGPDWLTGGTAGPEGSYLCIAIVVLVGVGVGLWLRTKRFPDPDALLASPKAVLAAPAVAVAPPANEVAV
jgi:membrane protease YdiL (CAAX protease family)